MALGAGVSGLAWVTEMLAIPEPERLKRMPIDAEEAAEAVSEAHGGPRAAPLRDLRGIHVPWNHCRKERASSLRSEPDLRTATLRRTPERREVWALRSGRESWNWDVERSRRRFTIRCSWPPLRSPPILRSPPVLRSLPCRRSTSGQEPRGPPCIVILHQMGSLRSPVYQKRLKLSGT